MKIIPIKASFLFEHNSPLIFRIVLLTTSTKVLSTQARALIKSYSELFLPQKSIAYLVAGFRLGFQLFPKQ